MAGKAAINVAAKAALDMLGNTLEEAPVVGGILKSAFEKTLEIYDAKAGTDELSAGVEESLAGKIQILQKLMKAQDPQGVAEKIQIFKKWDGVVVRPPLSLPPLPLLPLSVDAPCPCPSSSALPVFLTNVAATTPRSYHTGLSQLCGKLVEDHRKGWEVDAEVNPEKILVLDSVRQGIQNPL
jgi:hypothetical protein